MLIESCIIHSMIGTLCDRNDFCFHFLYLLYCLPKFGYVNIKVKPCSLCLCRFYDAPAFSDVTVVTPAGKKIRVHQLVLAACSRRFATILEQGMYRQAPL